VLAAIGANMSFAVGVVLTKRFPAPSNRLAVTGWQLLMSGVILVPLTALAEGVPGTLTGSNVAGFAYLSLAATAVAFVLWFNGIRRLPTAAPPLLGLAAPVTGAALGWAILDQSLSPLQVTGFVVTLAAIGYGASLPASAPGAVPLDERDGRASGHRPDRARTSWRPHPRPGDKRLMPRCRRGGWAVVDDAGQVGQYQPSPAGSLARDPSGDGKGD
jgi:probable blue pigment (indigoidine) exporter